MVEKMIEEVKEKLKDHEKLGKMFESCYRNTLEKTMKQMADGTTYVITGDIPAMWLRDSAAQIKPYLPAAKEDKKIEQMIVGLIKLQFQYINIDAYANAFNEEANGACWSKDKTRQNDFVWERKYEIDSLCYPVWLSYLLWKNNGCVEQFDTSFIRGVRRILEVFKTEQNHEEASDYRFERENTYFTDTLSREGRGALVKSGIGLTWSGFRPSDDACVYGYLIPSNMFAVVILRYLSEISEKVLHDPDLKKEADALGREIREGIEKYAITEKEGFGRIYAYEIDGYGQFNLMDDANVPSLLSMKYFGYEGEDPEVAKNTRRFILSQANPYFYRGKRAEGIGSLHTPAPYIWHIALAMQGLTADTKEEMRAIIDTMADTDAGTLMMHEGFHAEDDRIYTREWFSWANAMFCELVLKYCEVW